MVCLKRGFTLVEIITVLAIIGVGIGLFYSVFLLNWFSYDREIVFTNLWTEMSEIIQRISFDARFANNMNLVNDKEVIFSFFENSSVTYTMTPAGILQRVDDGGISTILSQNLLYSNSSFVIEGGYLKMNLTLVDKTFRGDVVVKTSTKVCPRNIIQ